MNADDDGAEAKRSGLDPTLPPTAAAIDATLARGSAAPAGTDATLARGSAAPAGIDATMASGPAAPAASAAPGALPTVTAAHYQIERELSRGGMGRVLIATDRRLGRTIAVKEMLGSSPDARARFEREARITSRLQHPGVVPLYEAGRWSNGEPFYAMKLVEGKPLKRLIDDRPTLRERLGLLPNVAAVADALAFAHSRRVIHRDLKPDNILVGDYGETIIIDWGLAKELDDPTTDDEADAAPTRADAAAPDATAVGSVLGTPVYMPPEQARGERVDQRADVYALGAVLYHLLTGKVPYAGATSSIAVIDKLLAGPPAPIATLVADAPADLIAIAEKATAREPAQRYPSARELADDLRRYTTGQLVGAHAYSIGELLRRWARRHRAVLTVGAVAVAVLAVVGVVGVTRLRRERAAAIEARRAAVASRGDAEDLVDYMLTDLKDKLSAVGRLDAIGGTIDKVNAYYHRRDAGTDTARDSWRRADALVEIGLVAARLGDSAKAEARFREASTIATQALARAPDDLELYKLAWRADRSVAQTLIGLGKDEDALSLLDRAFARPLPAGAPADEHDRIEAELHASRLEVLENRAHDDAALGEAHAAQAAATRAAAAHPDDVELAIALQQRTIALAKSLNVRNQSDDALATYRQAAALIAPLIARAPDDARLRLAHARAQDGIGDVLMMSLHRAADALVDYQAMGVDADALVQIDPSDVGSIRLQSVVEEKLATAGYFLGDGPNAIAHIERCIELRKQLVARNPRTPDASRELATAYERASVIYDQQGATAQAVGANQACIALREALAAKDPKSTGLQREVAISYFQLGALQSKAKQYDDAIASMTRADQLFVALMAAEPDVALHPSARTTVLAQLATTRSLAGDHAGEEAALREAVAVAATLANSPQATDDARIAQAKLSRQLGELVSSRGRLDDGLALIEGARAILDPIRERAPGDVTIIDDDAYAMVAQVRTLAQLGPRRRAEAKAIAEQARALIAERLRLDPAASFPKELLEVLPDGY